MSLTRENNPLVLHRERPDGKTVEFVLGHIDELITKSIAAIPFDNPTAHDDWLKRSIADGGLSCATITLDGVNIGAVTYAVVGDIKKELLISTAFIDSKEFSYMFLLKTFAEKIAKQNNCEYIRFHTIRKGLIKAALDYGCHISEIVLRIKVTQ